MTPDPQPAPQYTLWIWIIAAFLLLTMHGFLLSSLHKRLQKLEQTTHEK